MRQFIPALLCVIGLVIACHGFALSEGAVALEAKGSADLPQLLKDLTHPGDKVDKAAVEALTKIGLDRPDEIFKAFKESDAKTRPEVAKVLGKMRAAAYRKNRVELAESTEKTLLKALRDPNHWVVGRASEALTGEEPRCEKAIPIFIEILKDKTKTNACRSAAWGGLQRLGPAAKEAIPLLLDSYYKIIEKKREFVRDLDNTTEYIEGDRIGILSAMATISPEDERVLDTLRKTVRNAKEPVGLREVAIHRLSDMGEKGQSVVPDLIKIIADRPEKKKLDLDEVLGPAAVEALAKLRIRPKDVPLLLKIAGNKWEMQDTRKNAIKALYYSPEASRTAWLPLFHILDTQEIDNLVTGAIVIALRGIEPPDSIDRDDIRRELGRVLGGIKKGNKNDDYLQREIDLTLKRFEEKKSK